MPHEALDGYPIDEDYVEARSAEPQRADVDWDPDAEDDLDRAAADDYSHQYSTQPGTLSASAFDEKADEDGGIVPNDGRSTTRTWFNPSDAKLSDERSDQYWRLMKINDGMYDRTASRATLNQEADNQRWIDTICGHLGIGGDNRERVRHIVDGTNLRLLGGPYIAEEVVLASITLVVAEDAIERRVEPWYRTDETFQQLCEDVETNMSRLRRVRVLLRDKSDAL